MAHLLRIWDPPDAPTIAETGVWRPPCRGRLCSSAAMARGCRSDRGATPSADGSPAARGRRIWPTPAPSMCASTPFEGRGQSSRPPRRASPSSSMLAASSDLSSKSILSVMDRRGLCGAMFDALNKDTVWSDGPHMCRQMAIQQSSFAATISESEKH